MQDDFFEEALGLHQDTEEDADGPPADSKSQHAKGKVKEKSRGFARSRGSAKSRGMGNKARLRR